MDKLKNVIEGIARIERKVDALAVHDRRLKVTQGVLDKVMEMHAQKLKPAEIGRRMLLLHQVKLSDPTIRKIIKQQKGAQQNAKA